MKKVIKKDMEKYLNEKVAFVGILESFNLNHCSAYRCVVETKNGTVYDVLLDNVTGEERILCCEQSESYEGEKGYKSRQHIMEQFNLRLIRAQYNRVTWDYFSKKVMDVVKNPSDVFGYYDGMTSGI